MLMLDLLTNCKSLHHCNARRAAVSNTDIPLGEKGDRLHRAVGRFIQSNLPSLMLTSPLCSKPLSSKHTHASFLLSPLQARKCRVATKAHSHIKLLSSRSAILFHNNAIPLFPAAHFHLFSSEFSGC